MSGLKAVRKKCGLTIMDVAKKLGVSKQAVSSWENGTKDIPAARKSQLASLFGLEPAYFDKGSVISPFEDVTEDAGAGEYVQGKKDQKNLENRIHKTFEGPGYLNLSDQAAYINRGLLLYRRFVDVINLLYSQDPSAMMECYTRILETLDGMISAMGGQIFLHREIGSPIYDEKRDNVDQVKELFAELLRTSAQKPQTDFVELPNGEILRLS